MSPAKWARVSQWDDSIHSRKCLDWVMDKAAMTGKTVGQRGNVGTELGQVNLLSVKAWLCRDYRSIPLGMRAPSEAQLQVCTLMLGRLTT